MKRETSRQVPVHLIEFDTKDLRTFIETSNSRTTASSFHSQAVSVLASTQQTQSLAIQSIQHQSMLW